MLLLFGAGAAAVFGRRRLAKDKAKLAA